MRPQKFRGNVFVANLPKGFSDAELAQAFDRFGMVMGVCLARDAETGITKGHGLVDIAPASAAAEAVAELNGTEMGGRKIEARLADPGMALTIVAPRGQGAPEPPRVHGGHDRAHDQARYHGGYQAGYEDAPRPPRRAPVQVEVRRARRPS